MYKCRQNLMSSSAYASGGYCYKEAQNESGRSMVEMLGVLAVIAVLSVAGIAGYSSAMNKHRANELLNETSKRSVVVAMQIASGKTVPTTADQSLIMEFTDPTGYTFKVSKANDNQFYIEITGVTEAVCNQMKAAKGGAIKDLTPADCASNPVKLLYNNDLSTSESSNTLQSPGLARDVPCGDGFCAHGETCVDAELEDGYYCGGHYTESPKCCQSESGACPPGMAYALENCITCASPNFSVTYSGQTICCSPQAKRFDNDGSVYNTTEGCCSALGGFNNWEHQDCCRGDGYNVGGSVSSYCCNSSEERIFYSKNGNFYQLSVDHGVLDTSSIDKWACCIEEGTNTDEWCIQAHTAVYDR